MKRSEMKNIIDCKINISNEDLELILSVIEEAGMLPPQTSKPISDYNLDALRALTTAYHKWEKE